MDLREKKTKRSIQNAFLQLRAHKPLEKITVKELAELAEISKATFYLHYEDIFDLSRRMQRAVIEEILNSLIEQYALLFHAPRLPQILTEAIIAHQSLIDILFSGGQDAALPAQLEQGLREYVFGQTPGAREDVKWNVLLTYQVYGAWYAYMDSRKRFGHGPTLDVLNDISTVLFDAFIGSEL